MNNHTFAVCRSSGAVAEGRPMPDAGRSVYRACARARRPPEYTIAAGGTPRLWLADHSRHDLARHDLAEIHCFLHGELKGDCEPRLRDPFVVHERVLHGVVDARYGGAQGGARQPVKYALDIGTIGITNHHDHRLHPSNHPQISPPVNSLRVSSILINARFAKKS